MMDAQKVLDIPGAGAPDGYPESISVFPQPLKP
jgi:hypothetical protein